MEDRNEYYKKAILEIVNSIENIDILIYIFKMSADIAKEVCSNE